MMLFEKSRKKWRQEVKSEDDLKPLTQEELKAWWPFERLDPKRFPKQDKAAKSDDLDDVEEALL